MVSLLVVSVRVFVESSNWREKTHLEGEWCHPISWGPRLNQKESGEKPAVYQHPSLPDFPVWKQWGKPPHTPITTVRAIFSPHISPLMTDCTFKLRAKQNLPSSRLSLSGLWPWACEKETVAQLSLSSLKEPKCDCTRLRPDLNSRGILFHAHVLGSIKANPGNLQAQYVLWYLTSLLVYSSVLTKQQTVVMFKQFKFYLYLVHLPVCVCSHQRSPCRSWFSPLSLRYQTQAISLLRKLLHSPSHLHGQVAGFGLCYLVWVCIL